MEIYDVELRVESYIKFVIIWSFLSSLTMVDYWESSPLLCRPLLPNAKLMNTQGINSAI